MFLEDCRNSNQLQIKENILYCKGYGIYNNSILFKYNIYNQKIKKRKVKAQIQK